MRRARRRASKFLAIELGKKLRLNAFRIETPDIPHHRMSDSNQRKSDVAGRHFEDSQQASQASSTHPGAKNRGGNVQVEPATAAPDQNERNDLSKVSLVPEVEPAAADSPLNADDEPPDLEALLEERRRKRRELLERLAGTQSGVNSATPSSLDGSTGAQSTGTTGKRLRSNFVDHRPILQSLMPIFISIADIRASASQLRLSASNSGLNTNGLNTNAKPSPPADEGFELAKAGGKGDSDVEILPAEIKADTLDGEAQISAADYNPDDDRKLDDERRKVHDTQAHAAPAEQGVADGGEATKADNVEVDEDEYEEVEEDVEDDDFDMFAVDDAPKKKRKVLKKKTVSVCRSIIKVLWYSLSFSRLFRLSRSERR